jgi:hypothetical protein
VKKESLEIKTKMNKILYLDLQMTSGRGADCEAQRETMYGQGKQAWVTLKGKGVPHPWGPRTDMLENEQGPAGRGRCR